MSLMISQKAYVDYLKSLEEIKVITQCVNKQQLAKLHFINGSFKKISHTKSTNETSTKTSPRELNLVAVSFFVKLTTSENNSLKNKILKINKIHEKLAKTEFDACQPDNYAAVAAYAYNRHLKKVLFCWNAFVPNYDLKITFPNDQLIKLHPSFTKKTSVQLENELSTQRYLDDLESYPQLKREDDLNDSTKGAERIIYDPQEILKSHENIYKSYYARGSAQGLSAQQAERYATLCARHGVIGEDQYVRQYRDYVESPNGSIHIYNRFIPVVSLNSKVCGAATLIVKKDENHIKKILLQIAFRHTTGVFEWKTPRGAAEPSDKDGSQTATREVKEETGCDVKVIQLGSITPDSGTLTSVVPLFYGEVTAEDRSQLDTEEAIYGQYWFSLDEIEKGIQDGYLSAEINGKTVNVPLRCPYFISSFALAALKGLLYS